MNILRMLSLVALLTWSLTFCPPSASASSAASYGSGLRSVTVEPISVVGGGPATGTVRLTGPAPSGGLTVSLTSSSSAAAVPASVTVAERATSATFSISTTVVSTASPVTISGTLGETTKVAELTVEEARISSISTSPTAVIGGSICTGMVVLDGAAPGDGTVVNLSSNSADASQPPTVTVAAGNSTATFTVTSKEVVSDVAVTLTARQGGRTKSTVLTIEAPLLQSVSVSPSSIVGGNAVSGTITLHHPAPNGGVILALSSDSPDASAPATITVPAGAKTNTFTITTLGLEIATRVTISASISGTIKTTSLTIQPAQMSGFIVSPNTVVGGSSATGTVYLNGSAPSDGATVTLTSSGINASVPKTVKVPAGATSVSFTVTTRAVSNLGTVILTAKYRGEVQTAGITLQPA